LRRRHEFYRVLRGIPDNDRVPGSDTVVPAVYESLRKGLAAGHADGRLRTLFEHDLRLLNDVLDRCGFADRYWVKGGLLLGWAREGRVLPTNTDADFAFSAQDAGRFTEAAAALPAAGFRRWFCFRNSAGEITQETFIRRGAKFEFHRMTEAGRQHQYYLYGYDLEGPVELVARLPRQELEAFEFLGRTWHKSVDHEAELEAIYGDWRTPDRAWSYMNERAIVARARWAPSALRKTR
jgi:hypothetical protein